MSLEERTLVVRNINSNVTRDILEELFNQAGPVLNVVLRNDFAYIEFSHKCSVAYSLALMDGIHLFGQILHLSPKISDESVYKYVNSMNAFNYAMACNPNFFQQYLPNGVSNQYMRHNSYDSNSSYQNMRQYPPESHGSHQNMRNYYPDYRSRDERTQYYGREDSREKRYRNDYNEYDYKRASNHYNSGHDSNRGHFDRSSRRDSYAQMRPSNHSHSHSYR